MSSVRKAKKRMDLWSRYHFRYRHLYGEDGPIPVPRGDMRAWDQYARAAHNAHRFWVQRLQKEAGAMVANWS